MPVQIPTECLQLRPRPAAPGHQQLVQRPPHRQQRLLQRHLIKEAVPIRPPHLEHLLPVLEQSLRPDALGMLLVQQPLQIAQQLGPAQLALPVRQAVLGAAAVGMHQPSIGVPDQAPQRRLAAAGINPKERGARADGHPQPAALRLFAPGGLIDPQVRLRLHRRLNDGIDRHQGVAHAGTTTGDAAQTHIYPTDLGQEGERLAGTEPIAPVQQPYEGGQARAKEARRRIRGSALISNC